MTQAVRDVRKVDLHTHLDGSLATATMLKQMGLDCGPAECQRLQHAIWSRDVSQFSRAAGHKPGLQASTGLAVFDFMNTFLQSEAELQAATKGVLAANSAHNCVSFAHVQAIKQWSDRTVKYVTGRNRDTIVSSSAHTQWAHFGPSRASRLEPGSKLPTCDAVHPAYSGPTACRGSDCTCSAAWVQC